MLLILIIALGVWGGIALAARSSRVATPEQKKERRGLWMLIGAIGILLVIINALKGLAL